MRNLLKCFLLLAFCLNSSPFAFSATQPKEYRFFSEIELTDTEQELHSFMLPLESLSPISSEASMRIFDANQREVPFLIHRWRGESLRETLSVKPFNSAIQPGREQSFEFRLPHGKKIINRIVLNIRDRNYNRVVSLYGKKEGEDAFKLIKEGMRIIRLTSNEEKINYIHSTLSFPDQELTHYKIVILNEPEQTPLSIQSVRSIDKRNVAEKRLTVPLSVRKLSDSELEDLNFHRHRQRSTYNTSSYYLVESPHPYLPLDRLQFEVQGDNFARKARLYTLSGENFFVDRLLASSTLFRYGSESQLRMSFTPTRTNRFILEIDQGHDLPIQVRSVSGSLIAWEVRFFFDKTGVYRQPLYLYYDTPTHVSPRYDIAQRIKRMGKKSYSAARMRQIKSNRNFAPSKKKLPKSEQIPYLLYISVGLLVFVLLYYLRKLVLAAPSDR